MADQLDEHGNPKMRGSEEPLDNKCGARLKDAELKWGMVRYCTLAKGQGTEHKGFGRCKHHGGSTPNHIVAAGREMAEEEARTLSEKLGAPPPLGDPIRETLDFAAEVLQWKDIIRQMLDDLNGEMEIVDAQGVERARAKVEMFERALDRCWMVLSGIQKLDLRRRVQELDEEREKLIYRLVVDAIGNPLAQLTDQQYSVIEGLLAAAFNQPENLKALAAPAEDRSFLEMLDAEIVENETVK